MNHNKTGPEFIVLLEIEPKNRKVLVLKYTSISSSYCIII